MADWVLIPCLKALFAEFDRIAPSRDHASDGSIGDAAHRAEVSDHNADEEGSVPIHDADHVNEVHAIDVDNQLREGDLTMEKVVQFLLGRCRSGAEKRLRYIIYNRRIWSASSGWVQKTYTGASPHTEHAHFSASYIAALEASVASWGLVEEFGGNEMLPIKNGAKSEDVRLCQMMLNDLLDAPAFAGEWAKLTTDGDYGDATQVAVNAYRKHYGQGGLEEISAWQFFCMMRDMAAIRAGKPGAAGKNGVDGKDGAPGQLTGTLNVTSGQLVVEAA